MTTIRHIIVEGPDGSGKDGLIRRLTPLFPNYQLHVRASTSTGGPIPSLTGWLYTSMARLDHAGPFMFNRHPLISELIYAPIARKTTPQGNFANAVWVREMTDQLIKRAVVVWCMPPKVAVEHNVSNPDIRHMPGVAETIGDIYDAYTMAIKEWPGPSLMWDYSVADIARLHYGLSIVMDA